MNDSDKCFMSAEYKSGYDKGYAHGMHLEDVGSKFNYTQNTVRNKLKDYLPTNELIEEFKREYVTKKLLKKEQAA